MSAEIADAIRSVTDAVEVAPLPGRWDPALWDQLEALGFTGVGIDEEDGGSGGTVADVLAVVRAAAVSAAVAGLPLGQNLVVGNWLRAVASMPFQGVPTALDTTGGIRLAADGGLHGHLPRVSFAGGHGRLLLVVTDPAGGRRLADLDAGADGVEVEPDADHVGVSRASITVQDARGARVSEPLPPAVFLELGLRAQLLATLQIAGALEAAQRLTTTYAASRTQFGARIDSFQMVKSMLAELAGETIVTSSAAVAATDVVADHGVLGAETAIRSAHVQATRAATDGARLAHQVHGTIGVTAEYALHHHTGALRFWRRYGPGEHAGVLDLGRRVAAAGADGFWTTVVGA